MNMYSDFSSVDTSVWVQCILVSNICILFLLCLLDSLNILLLDSSKTVLHETIVTNILSESCLVNVSKVKTNSNKVTLRAIVIVSVVIINDYGFSFIVIGSKVLEFLDVFGISKDIVSVNSLEMHCMALHVTVVHVFD